MILVDTDVASEVRKIARGKADPTLTAWIARTPAALLRLSVVSIMEIRIGIGRLARRDPDQAGILSDWFDARLLPAFRGRILPVDEKVASLCANLHVPDPRPERDALIAATALAHGLTVATRNTRDFAAMGVPVVNPWTAIR